MSLNAIEVEERIRELEEELEEQKRLKVLYENPKHFTFFGEDFSFVETDDMKHFRFGPGERHELFVTPPRAAAENKQWKVVVQTRVPWGDVRYSSEGCSLKRALGMVKGQMKQQFEVLRELLEQ